MQAVCDTLEQLVSEGVLKQYAIGGATAAGFHGEPLATRDVDVFVFLDPPAGALLVSLDSLFSRLSQLGFNEFEEEGLLICPFSSFALLPGWRRKRSNKHSSRNGTTTGSE